MDQFYAVASLSILAISILWYIKSSLSPKTGPAPLPPGPRGVPVLGYLPFLGGNLLEKFTNLAHKHGPIFKIDLGNKLCVVINSPALVRDVVRNQDTVFANRDVPIAATIASYGANDIGWSKLTPEWRAMRKLFVQEMMSNKSLQASYVLRKDEVLRAIGEVYSKTGKPLDIGELSNRTQLNVIMNMLWGGTMEGSEVAEWVGVESRAVLSKIVDLLGKPNLSDFYPVLAGLDIQGVKKEMKGYVQSMDRIFDAVIGEHKKKQLAGDIKKEGKKDFLQILLEIQSNQDSEMSISQKQLKGILMDIVAAGSDTTSTTVEWAMAELMNNPDVMKKVQKELSDVVGLDNIVDESHMPKLKYLEAVAKETMRIHPAIPLLIPRSPSESTTVGGYSVPTNTRVFINVWSIHRDPSIWENPTEFRPERFLGENSEKWDFRGNHPHYLPFGSGRRMCPGISLGERMLFHLLASLLHSFDWKLANGDQKVDLNETVGIVLRKTTPLVGLATPRLSHSHLYL